MYMCITLSRETYLSWTYPCWTERSGGHSKENMHCVLDWVEVNPVALGHYRTMSEGRKADPKVLYSLMKMVMEDH